MVENVIARSTKPCRGDSMVETKPRRDDRIVISFAISEINILSETDELNTCILAYFR